MKKWIQIKKEPFGRFTRVQLLLFQEQEDGDTFDVNLGVLTDGDLEQLAQELIEAGEAL